MPMLAPKETRPAKQQIVERERLESEIEEFKQSFKCDPSGVQLVTGTYSAVSLVVGTSSRANASWYEVARSFFPGAREMNPEERRHLHAVRTAFYRPISEKGRDLDPS